MPNCYHCGLPIPDSLHLSVVIQGQSQLMCCAGCQAVAQAIVDAGLQDFYTYRTDNAPTGQVLVPEFLKQTAVYDNPSIQKRFVHHESEHICEVALILEGVTCAACIWLNEHHLRSLNGVLEVQINYSTHRARVRWDNTQIQLSKILQAVSHIGYLARPYDPQHQQAFFDRERKQQLKRIGVAGVCSMQVMMISVALYAGEWTGIEAEFKALFHWMNLILTLPILLYAATPFFRSAWRDIQRGRTGMDVPVTVGILLAFVGSVWVTLTGSIGQVYYDSIAMFVFFLLTGRYFEFVAQQRSVQAAESLVHLVPTTAIRLIDQGKQEELVLVVDLAVGDSILVRPGDSIPIDGVVTGGRSTVNESLLTGESHPILKQIGQSVIAGSINIESPLQICVDKVGPDTVLSHILRLLERAQMEKPAMTQLADKVASWFVFSVLLLAIGVAVYWWQMDSPNWLAITLSVLVITCPCALSLATPAAISAATSTLTQIGLLTTRGHALETLARATHIVFDKTGTLTTGNLRLLDIHTFSHVSTEDCLRCAVALERFSEHPIAQALLNACPPNTLFNAHAVHNQPGAGLYGMIGETCYFIGTPAFIHEKTNLTLPLDQLQDLQQQGHTLVILANAQMLYSAFILSDEIRDGAHELVKKLQQQGKTVNLLSGDQVTAVQRIANAVGIPLSHCFALQTPRNKLERIKELQAQGAIVAMVGDGVNDAPVLAQAQVSIAMGSGTQIARASADMILLTEHLLNLLTGINIAQKTLHIIRQNLLWAIVYNILTLPAAAMGWIMPWLAALGMSLSSLLVVVNALRLVKKP